MAEMTASEAIATAKMHAGLAYNGVIQRQCNEIAALIQRQSRMIEAACETLERSKNYCPIPDSKTHAECKHHSHEQGKKCWREWLEGKAGE